MHELMSAGPPLDADEYVLDNQAVRGLVAAAGRRSAPRTRPRRRATRSDRISRACSPTTRGSPRPTSRMRRRAAWAAASGSGCSFARPTGRCRSSRWSFPPGAQTPSTTTSRGGWSDCTAAPRTSRCSPVTANTSSWWRAACSSRVISTCSIPPRDDIHRVRTTSPSTSVSLHLLTNDTGCVWRHRFEPDSGEVRPFRSGYVNVECEEESDSARQ